MNIPSYLTTSRHNVYYFRWPIPRSMHPHHRASDIKLSLGTKDCNEALQLSRLLAYMAHRLTIEIKNNNMRYDKMRELLRQHFTDTLERVKNSIAQKGRLKEHQIEHFKETLQWIGDDSYIDVTFPDGRHPVHDVIEEHGLPFKEDTPEYLAFKEEYNNSRKSFCQEVLDYDASLIHYNFKTKDTHSQQSINHTQQSITLEQLVEKYVAEKMRGNLWKPQTEKGLQSKFRLLYNIVSKDTPCTTIDIADARNVKEIMQRVPKNINTRPETRDLSFKDALALESVDRMDTKTINTHLAAYTTLFKWADENGYVDKNIFTGLSMKQKKSTKASRVPFSREQSELILRAIINNELGLIKKDFQKWGSLIGLFTGARLNEIAQLHVDDIRQEEGIWCFDINEETDGKELKTASATRLIPIHSKLIELGILDYVNEVKTANKTRLLHELTYDRNDGYGRKLGRWFNGTFLKAQGIKKPTLVFHGFRHGMITSLIQSGVEEPLAKSIVGHSQEGVTQTVYFKQGYTVAQKQAALETLSWKP